MAMDLTCNGRLIATYPPALRLIAEIERRFPELPIDAIVDVFAKPHIVAEARRDGFIL